MRCTAAEIYLSSGSFMKAMSQAPVNDWLTYGWEGGRARTSTGCSVFPFAFLRMRGLPYVSEPSVKDIDAASDARKPESPSVSAAGPGCGWSVTTRRPTGETACCVYERGAGGDDIMLALPLASV